MEGWAVVSDQPLHFHTQLGEICVGLAQEALCTVFSLVRAHGCKGYAGVIVDGDEQILPSVALCTPAVVAGDSVADACEASELLTSMCSRSPGASRT